MESLIACWTRAGFCHVNDVKVDVVVAEHIVHEPVGAAVDIVARDYVVAGFEPVKDGRHVIIVIPCVYYAYEMKRRCLLAVLDHVVQHGSALSAHFPPYQVREAGLATALGQRCVERFPELPNVASPAKYPPR